MRTGFQIFVDKQIGPVFNLFLYSFVRLTGKILRIDHSLDKPFTRIIVCKYKGLGSIVQASALLSTLRQNYPDAEIRFLSTKGNKGILNFYRNSINEDILIDDSSFIRLLKSSAQALLTLWKFKPQVFIDLEVYSNFSTFICTLSAAKNRIGYYKSDKDYRTGLFTHLMYFNIKAPLSEIYLQMARILPIENISHDLILPEISEDLNSQTQNLLQKLGINQHTYIVINPNASDLRLERRWPANSFIKLIEDIRNKYENHQILLIGNNAESDYVSEIKNHFLNDSNVINSAGKLSINELIAAISQAKIVITNDTGPLHISLSLKKKTIGLFGPCSPAQYGQMETCISIYENLYCSPCVHEFMEPPCKGNNQCMKNIKVIQVMKAISMHFNNEIIPTSTNIIFYKSESNALGYVENRK
jgi:ADP-heptose:LPS heptosyltransferase